MFSSTTELPMSIGMPIKEVKAEIETHAVPVEVKLSKCSIWNKAMQRFLNFLLIRSFLLLFINETILHLYCLI